MNDFSKSDRKLRFMALAIACFTMTGLASFSLVTHNEDEIQNSFIKQTMVSDTQSDIITLKPLHSLSENPLSLDLGKKPLQTDLTIPPYTVVTVAQLETEVHKIAPKKQIKIRGNGDKMFVDIETGLGTAAPSVIRASRNAGYALTLFSFKEDSSTLQFLRSAKHLRLVQKDEQGQVVAEVETDISFDINSENNTLVGKSIKGDHAILVSPYSAKQLVTRSGLIDNVETIKLNDYSVESVNNPLQYDISGKKKIKLLGIVPIVITINHSVNVSNGTLVETKPLWFLNTFGFLFTAQ